MKMFHRCVSESVSDYQESVSECVSESKEGFRYVSESDTPILIIERSAVLPVIFDFAGLKKNDKARTIVTQ